LGGLRKNESQGTGDCRRGRPGDFQGRPGGDRAGGRRRAGAGASTERRKVPNTVATINTDNLRNAPVVNVSEQLAAREPGVSLLPSGGLAGEGARIRIRGAASLSQPNEPIVYVDGVRVDRSGGWGDYVGTGGGGNPSRIDDSNPEAVERIEVLK